MWRAYGCETAQKWKTAGRKQGDRSVEGEKDFLYLLLLFFNWNLKIYVFSSASKLYDKLRNSLETLKSLLVISHTWWVTIVQVSPERDPETSVEFPSACHKDLHGNLATKYSWTHSVIVEVNWAQHIEVSRHSFPQQADPQLIKAEWHTHWVRHME